MTIVYLDHAATTPLDPEVAAEMRPFEVEACGNPSSRHPAGVRAAEALDHARRRLARVFEARPEGVVFTSGGTEANNLAVFGHARAAAPRAAAGRGHVLLGPTEHASVRVSAAALAAEGFEVEHLGLTPEGELDLERAARQVRDDTLLVAQSLVQSEVGSVYPVARLARLVRARAARARVHVDAVQAVGKLEVSLVELEADSLSVSAHKLHGPKGAGALVRGPEVALAPLLFGGDQEHGLRAGTQNVTGAVGLGAAVEHAERTREEAWRHAAGLRATLEAALSARDDVRVMAPGSARVPSIVALLLERVPAEVCLHHLEQRGVYVSAGSACQAAKRDVNPTYAALGLSSDQARRVLRLSFARTTGAHEVEGAARALCLVLDELERRGLCAGPWERAGT